MCIRDSSSIAIAAASVAASFDINDTAPNPQRLQQPASSNPVESLPKSIREATQNPLQATALVFVLGLIRAKSEHIMLSEAHVEFFDPPIAQSILRAMESLLPTCQDLQEGDHLICLELCLSALKNQSKRQYLSFLKAYKSIISQSKQSPLKKWCYYTLLVDTLNVHFGLTKRKRPKHGKPKQVFAELQIILSLIAHEGHGDEQEAARAYGKAANSLTLYQYHLLNKDELSISHFYQAVREIDHCFPLVKRRILKAIVKCIEHDGAITTTEMELVRTIAAAIDCPMSPIP